MLCVPQEKHEREEEERKRRIQLYVFVLRTIAYPFNAKQLSDNKRHLRVTPDGLDKMKGKIEVGQCKIPYLFVVVKRSLC